MLKGVYLLCLVVLQGLQLQAQLPSVFINEIATYQTLEKDQFKSYTDWVELYNAEDTAVNVGGYYFSDDFSKPKKFQIDGRYVDFTKIPAKGYLRFWMTKDPQRPRPSHIELNLSPAGESLALYDKDIKVVDSVSFPRQFKNTTYCRVKDGSKSWAYSKNPTPGKANAQVIYKGVSGVPEVSLVGGFYEKACEVKLHSKQKKTTLYFSTDGSVPLLDEAHRYKKPLTFEKITVLRFRAVEEGKLPSDVVTHSYFITHSDLFPVAAEKFKNQNTLPVVSLALSSGRLLSESNATPIYEESPTHLEYFDRFGKRGFGVNGGLRLVGKAIRNYPQKSMAFRLRSIYGKEEVEYTLYESKPNLNKNSAFLLRNSGNDWSHTLFRDALMHTLVSENMHVDYQAYQPVHVFVNGEYWGIHNLREKISRVYLESNYPDVRKVDLFEFGSQAIQGDRKHLSHLENFINENDLSIDANYDSVAKWIDLDNFIDYQIAEIFYANTDWPMANMKFWRPKTPEGKWRWILFDTDLAFELKKLHHNGHHNTLEYALGVNNYHFPVFDRSLDESTKLLQKLITNARFKARFLCRFSDLMNSNFSTPNMLQTIDSLERQLSDEMPLHIDRWGEKGGISSMEKWKSEVDVMRQFATERPDTMRRYIVEQFDLKGTVNVQFKQNSNQNVRLGSMILNENTFEGIYFIGSPLHIELLPNQKAKFSHWLINGEKHKQTALDLMLVQDLSIEVVFR